MTHPIMLQNTEMTASQTNSRMTSVWQHGLVRMRNWCVTPLLVLVGTALGACKDLTKDPALPAGTPNPSFYNTADGAKGLRVGTIANLELAIPYYLEDSGLLSDELVDSKIGTDVTQSDLTIPDPLDERLLSEGGPSDVTDAYYQLQTVRGSANVALGALAAYDTMAVDSATQRVMRGELYAFQGYSEILLAELYCSGVPLSTLDFQRDFTYQPSSTAQQVYVDAMTKLDSAIALAAGNDSVLNLARVLKGRAQLQLGKYSAAADDVSAIPTTFQYRMMFPVSPLFSAGVVQIATVADREGTNGQPYLSGGDVRTAVTATCQFPSSDCPIQSFTMPAKYFGTGVRTGAGYAPFVMASGIEARLIAAEAALQAHDMTTWLTTLNQLRENAATLLGQPGAVLNDTTDPGTAAARVALLFHERAYWLFMTGHRQGDLRRLLRQYGTQFPAAFGSDQRVYPSGVYPAPGSGQYGSDVTVPIPSTEYNNPNYHGCLDRRA